VIKVGQCFSPKIFVYKIQRLCLTIWEKFPPASPMPYDVDCDSSQQSMKKVYWPDKKCWFINNSWTLKLKAMNSNNNISHYKQSSLFKMMHILPRSFGRAKCHTYWLSMQRLQAVLPRYQLKA
jgi:hypothetical protein